MEEGGEGAYSREGGEATSISNAYCVLSHTQWPRQSAEAGAGCGMVEIIPLLLCKLSFSPQVPSMILKPILG